MRGICENLRGICEGLRWNLWEIYENLRGIWNLTRENRGIYAVDSVEL